MTSMIKPLLGMILVLTLAGCSSHFQSVNQINESAFLQLEGNFINSQLVIDDNDPVDLTNDKVNTFTLKGKTVARFPVSTGKHTLKVITDNVVVVERVFYVSNSNTFEVVVP